jgi:hypothetical protein
MFAGKVMRLVCERSAVNHLRHFLSLLFSQGPLPVDTIKGGHLINLLLILLAIVCIGLVIFMRDSKKHRRRKRSR